MCYTTCVNTSTTFITILMVLWIGDVISETTIDPNQTYGLVKDFVRCISDNFRALPGVSNFTVRSCAIPVATRLNNVITTSKHCGVVLTLIWRCYYAMSRRRVSTGIAHVNHPSDTSVSNHTRYNGKQEIAILWTVIFQPHKLTLMPKCTSWSDISCHHVD